jgi:N-acetylmuramoyl-L-alanine amidase
MPAVLVEVGFIDHPIEGRQLADPAVQAQLADAITEAITEQLGD